MTARQLSEIIRPSCAFSFARAGGPGGQNVNKVASKVVARIALRDLAFLAGDARIRVENRLANRINDRGELVVTVQDTRDQARNREIAVARAAALLAGAMRRPKARKKTRPGAAAREARIGTKKRRAADKRLRGPVSEE